jgi:signal transduction histidine kinase
MFETIQLVSLGVAAGIDTLLLIVLLEPRNRRFTPTPVLLVTFGVWLWHTGLVALLLLFLADHWAAPFRSLALTAACAGALLTPSAMIHCLARLWRTGLKLGETPQPVYLLAYLPMLALPLCFGRTPLSAEDPLGPVAFALRPYLAWSSAVNVAVGILLLRSIRRIDDAAVRWFFGLLGVFAFVRTMVHVGVFLTVPDEPYAQLVVLLSPVGSMTLFGYFVLRHNFLYLTLERGTLYAGVVAGVFLLHQFLFVTLTSEAPNEARVLFVVVETLVLTGLVLAVPRWRQRCTEAVRYLLGARVRDVRARLRQLAIDLAGRADARPLDTFDWFADRLRHTLDVEFVVGWIFDDAGAVRGQCGAATRFAEADVRLLLTQLCDAKLDACTPDEAPTHEMSTWLQGAAASLAIVKGRRSLTGLLLLGRHARNRELSAEEVAAVLFLVEELVITLDNRLLHAERLDAERRAVQGEKLAALGLLASSVAHEVKNPLSAIKTIATVLAEDLGPADPHAEDLRLILGEVDRLAATTTQLLDFARPRVGDGRLGCAVAALSSTLAVLRHLARQREVVLDASIPSDLPHLRADDQAIREIFFNLVSNALEAAGRGGRVAVACVAEDGHLVTRVRDTGPGLPAAVRERLFEPFLTTKETGTGLGLHVVGRRVRELGGSITCGDGSEGGATFIVRLPIRAAEEEST